jgi:hypothetical protein
VIGDHKKSLTSLTYFLYREIITLLDSMETFFDIVAFIMLCISIWMNFIMLKRVASLEQKCEFFQRKFVQTLDVHGEDFDRLEKKQEDLLVLVKAENERSKMVLRDNLEPTKPMKSNNWNSLREAFKPPNKIVSNVGN